MALPTGSHFFAPEVENLRDGNKPTDAIDIDN